LVIHRSALYSSVPIRSRDSIGPSACSCSRTKTGTSGRRTQISNGSHAVTTSKAAIWKPSTRRPASSRRLRPASRRGDAESGYADLGHFDFVERRLVVAMLWASVPRQENELNGGTQTK